MEISMPTVDAVSGIANQNVNSANQTTTNIDFAALIAMITGNMQSSTTTAAGQLPLQTDKSEISGSEPQKLSDDQMEQLMGELLSVLNATENPLLKQLLQQISGSANSAGNAGTIDTGVDQMFQNLGNSAKTSSLETQFISDLSPKELEVVTKLENVIKTLDSNGAAKESQQLKEKVLLMLKQIDSGYSIKLNSDSTALQSESPVSGTQELTANTYYTKGKLENLGKNEIKSDQKKTDLTEAISSDGIKESFLAGKLNNAQPKDSVNKSTASPLVKISNIEEIKAALNQQITQVKETSKTSMTIKLQPEELGHMKIQLDMKDGTLQGKIFVDSETAKNALQQQVDTIKTQIKSQGINLESLEVNIGSNFQHQQFQEQQSGERNFSQNQKRFMNAMFETELNASIAGLTENQGYTNKSRLNILA